MQTTSSDDTLLLGNRMLIYASRLEEYGTGAARTIELRFKSARKSKLRWLGLFESKLNSGMRRII